MNVPENMSRVIGGKRYSVKKAVLIASDLYWDGSNWERRGRNMFLYRAANGSYFTVKLTRWQGERDTLEPVTRETALYLWDQLPEHEASFEVAFPGVQVQDA